MKTSFRVALLYLAVCFMCSCRRNTCGDDNAVFNNYTPFQPEYKRELMTQLNNGNNNDVTYYMNQRVERMGRVYMVVHIKGEHLCAKAVIDISNEPDGSKIKAFKKPFGGVDGRKMKGLRFRADSTGGQYNIVYENVDEIE